MQSASTVLSWSGTSLDFPNFDPTTRTMSAPKHTSLRSSLMASPIRSAVVANNPTMAS